MPSIVLKCIAQRNKFAPGTHQHSFWQWQAFKMLAKSRNRQ